MNWFLPSASTLNYSSAPVAIARHSSSSSNSSSKGQSSKQAEIPRIINVEACKDNNGNESKSDKNKENTDLNNKSVHSRVHGKEPHNRVNYVDQKYNYEHHNSIHYFSRNQLRVRYVNFFNGYYFCCSNFGHKVANCFYNSETFREGCQIKNR